MRSLLEDTLTTISNSTETNSTLTNETVTTNLIDKNLVWGMGMLTTVMLLLLSVILTLFIICLHTNIKSRKTINKIIIILVSLAVGSLLGDALIHIIPEVYATEEHYEEEEHHEERLRFLNSTDLNATDEVVEEETPKKSNNICSLLIIVGFMVCFILEKIFVIFGDEHSHSHGISEQEDEPESIPEDTCKHANTENKEEKNNCSNNKPDIINLKQDNKINENTLIKDSEKFPKVNDEVVIYDPETPNGKNDEIAVKDIGTKSKIIQADQTTTASTKLTCCQKLSFKGKKTVGILSTLSSLLHNFIDGLAIGVVFSSREKTTIVSTIIAIFLHEIPKEIADAGVLIHSEFTTAGILFWNVVNNVTGVLGTIIGLAIGTINKTSEAYCLAFVSGNFLYISLSDMVPLLINLKKGINNFFVFSFMIIGFGIMFLILLAEPDDH